MNPVRKSQCALVLVVALMAACGGEQTTTEPLEPRVPSPPRSPWSLVTISLAPSGSPWDSRWL